MQNKLNKLNNDFSFIYSLRLDKKIEEQEFTHKSNSISEERKAIKAELDLLNEKVKANNNEEQITNIKSIIESFLNEDVTTDIICSLIKRVEVSKSKINIIYQFQEY